MLVPQPGVTLAGDGKSSSSLASQPLGNPAVESTSREIDEGHGSVWESYVGVVAATTCFLSSPPEPDTIVYPGDPPVVVENQKMRYLSFSAGDLGKTQAVRVTFKDLPAPYDGWNDIEMWVQQPTTYCENSGKKLPPCPPAQPATDFLGAALDCAPWWGDFHSLGVIHVFHEGIVPKGIYWIEVVDAGCDYVANPDESFSAPLGMTQSRLGDLVRSCGVYPCTPPDGVVNMTSDVTAVLDKFRNLGPPAFIPAVRKVRADLDWAIPDQVVNISDATCCLDAFRGVGYPPPSFQAPSPPPCGGPPLASGL